MIEPGLDLYSRLENPIEAIDRMGLWFAKSQMFGCDNAEQGKVLALVCVATRQDPVTLHRKFHLMPGGRLAMRSENMLAEFHAAGGKHRIIERTAEAAELELEWNGDKHRFRYSWEDAKGEPYVWTNKVDPKGNRVLKDNWATPRARMQMLWARVISDAVRAVRPGIVTGVYTPEEIRDEPQAAGPALSMGPAPDPAALLPAPQQSNIIDLPEPAKRKRASKAPAPTPAAPDDEAELAAAGLAPAQEPPAGPRNPDFEQKPPAEPAAAPEAAPTDPLGKLQALIQPIEAQATAYVQGTGVVKPGQTVWDLPPRLINKILQAPDAFLSAVKAHR